MSLLFLHSCFLVSIFLLNIFYCSWLSFQFVALGNLTEPSFRWGGQVHCLQCDDVSKNKHKDIIYKLPLTTVRRKSACTFLVKFCPTILNRRSSILKKHNNLSLEFRLKLLLLFFFIVPSTSIQYFIKMHSLINIIYSNIFINGTLQQTHIHTCDLG